jgi:membrane-associated phospholipid phosphatase
MNPRNLWRDFTAEWKIKVFLGGAITAGFWYGYFLLERLPAVSVTQMPELAIDRMIPFRPGAAFIYVSQFATMPLTMWLMPSRCQLLACCRSLSLLIGLSFFVFYSWPTAVVQPEVIPHQYFFYDLIAAVDLPRNACPSLHAAFGVFTAGCAIEVFRSWKGGVWGIVAVWSWTIAVLTSTLLIKQHVFLDLLAGIAVGMIGWWSMRWQLKREAVTGPQSPYVCVRPSPEILGILTGGAQSFEMSKKDGETPNRSGERRV